MLLKDKRAVVIGAGSGIGKSIADILLEESKYVVFSDISSERLNIAVDQAKTKGFELYGIVCNISKCLEVN